MGLTLVPTVAPGVNDSQVGDILKFAMQNMPVVRGVHFQPVSYFGRCDLEQNEQRITIPDMLRYMEEQTDGMIKQSDFLGGGAENSYCSFHGNFMQMPDGTIKAIKSDSAGCCCTSSKQSRDFVAKRWSAAPVLTAQENSCCCSTAAPVKETSLFDVFLERMENYTLAVSGMLFQDAWNFDLERVKSCYLCEFSPKKKIVPFCAYNLSSISGETIHRGK